METHLTIDQDSPVNQLELSMVQSNDTYVLVENKLIDSSFACINIVRHIFTQSIQYAYKVNDDGLYVRTYDKYLELCLRHPFPLPDLADSNFECEHTKVFLKAIQDAVAPFINDEDIYSLWNSQPNRRFNVYDEESGLLKSNKTASELKNALTNQISKLVNTPEFRRAIAARSERSKNQFERSSKLVQGLRDRFSKLLVLRIDLGWKAAIQDDSTFDEMKAFLSQFLKRFHHDPTLPNIVGYIWKLEFGQKKGYHYHCMFFMDGNKFQNDSHYAEVIGQRWAELTLNKGYYFNCHRDKIKYRNLAIGTAHHNDQTFYDNLDQVLVYICKQDQFLIDKRLLKSNLRVFGTSQLPSKASPVGRPRDFKNLPKPSTSLAVVVKKKQLRSTP
ncbi:MAG: inovirus-type Gp2 protein [Proteobacteria bacterium]|nr:inovirus-type Gp2 protein [Pseudomonadota bacterium]MDA1254900.1 inovirus-type Gp2 protein [Pseudomonadota bacterium]